MKLTWTGFVVWATALACGFLIGHEVGKHNAEATNWQQESTAKFVKFVRSARPGDLLCLWNNTSDGMSCTIVKPGTGMVNP